MMFGRKKLYSSVLTAGLVLAGIGSAVAIETQARNAILMDYDTGQYLYVKDHEKMVPPASMSKLMTVNMIFEKLKDGSLSLDDTFTVSERAWKLGGAASGGSTMFLKIGEKVRVEDILKVLYPQQYYAGQPQPAAVFDAQCRRPENRTYGRSRFLSDRFGQKRRKAAD